jgi:flagellar protein FliO/FliZ
MGDAASTGVPVLPWFEAVVATLIVLALLGATLWLLRKGLSRQTGAGAVMSVESSLSLGERRSLVVVRVEGRRLLMGVAPGQVRLVTELGAAPASSTTATTGDR